MSHFPRIPVRFLAHNQELLKSQQALSGNGPTDTDYTSVTLAGSAPSIEPSYRAPLDRVSGNDTFRRYPNGDLDLDAATNVVVDIIHKVKDESPLTELEKIILGCMYPLMFPFVDSRLAPALMQVQLRLAPWEMAIIIERVSAHLSEELNWNAGIGGSSTRGRSTTRS